MDTRRVADSGVEVNKLMVIEKVIIMIKVKWATKPDGAWYEFEKFNFANIAAVGVYVIWHAGEPGQVVRVGQGKIGPRLVAHRADQTICRHRKSGELKVTWASVQPGLLDQVERFLGDHYAPIEGDRFPEVKPLAVNLPGA